MSFRVFKTGGTDYGRFTGPAVFFLSFAVYLVTLAPEVTFWDSGELAIGALSIGISHPPGYPVFCTLGRVFSLLPLGNAAYRINIMSAFFGSAAAYLLYRLVREIGAGASGSSLIAAAAALGLAFYRHFWSQAVVAKELTINAFLLMAVVTSVFYYCRERSVSFLYASAFLMGLAVANHQSALFIAPVYLGFFLLSGHNYKRPRVIAVSLFFFLLAFSVIIHLPIRATAKPALDIGDPKALNDFIWAMKWDTYIDTVKAIYSNVLNRVTFAWLALGALAASLCAMFIYLFRKKEFTLFMAFSALFSYASITALTLGAEGIEKMGLKGKFFIPAVVLSIPVAAEIFFLAWNKRPASGDARKAAAALAAIVLTAIPAWALAANWKDNDNSRNFFAYDMAMNTMKSIKPGAVLIGRGDNAVFPVWYVQGFERYRDDVFFMHVELLTYDWYMADIKERLRKKYGMEFIPPAKLEELETNISSLSRTLEKRTPVYFDYSAAVFLKVRLETFKPQGLVHLLPSWDAAPLADVWGRYVFRGAFDGSTNKAFAAEGILGIYAYEAVIWAQEAYQGNRPVEALKAYDLSRNFGLSNEFLDKWAQAIREYVKERQNY